ncbi:MAG: glycosyltransferase family 4 protein [Candidatus Hydrogenedentota bacterium]
MTGEVDKPAVLVVTEVPFWRGRSGAHERIAALVRTMQRAGHPVCVFYHTMRYPGERAAFRRDFPDVGFARPALPMLLLRGLRRRLGLRFPDETGDEPPAWERRYVLQSLCLLWQPPFVIVEYLRSAYLVEGLQAALEEPPVLMLDTHDVMHLREAHLGAKGEPGTTRLSRDAEAAMLARFDVLLAIQEEEARTLREMCPDTPVITVGHGHAVKPPRFRETACVRLVFVAAAGMHNHAAIDRFLRDVWPPLRQRHGDGVELHIAGALCKTLDASALPQGVILRGFVANLDAFYAEGDIAVNPVFAGSGLKIKNVEALCHGLPLVTTPIGAQGLDAGAGSAFAVGDSPEALIAALDDLIAHPAARRALAECAHTFAKEHLSEEKAYGPLVDLLEQDMATAPGKCSEKKI